MAGLAVLGVQQQLPPGLRQEQLPASMLRGAPRRHWKAMDHSTLWLSRGVLHLLALPPADCWRACRMMIELESYLSLLQNS